MLKGFFFAIAVGVAQSVKLWAVIHHGEVGEFVADDVAHQFLGHEHEHERKLNHSFACAMT